MTISDPARAAFVTHEYRYATPTPAYAVLARNPTARELTIDTQIDATSASALASSYLAENSNRRVFEFEIEGILTPNDFVGGPPAYILNAANYATDGRTLKVVSISVNEMTNTTLVQVRG
jgi:hypothetical protein